MFALAAPISCAGMVLSQFPSSTTPSIGLARMTSSTSMAMRLRYSIAEGFMRSSPSEIVAISTGMPPAASTPALTASARWRNGRLQGFSSLTEFKIPMIGFSFVSATGCPAARIAARWSSPTSSSRRNQRSLRRLTGLPLDVHCLGEPVESAVHLAFGGSVKRVPHGLANGGPGDDPLAVQQMLQDGDKRVEAAQHRDQCAQRPLDLADPVVVVGFKSIPQGYHCPANVWAWHSPGDAASVSVH